MLSQKSSDEIDYKAFKQLTKRIYGHEMPKAMQASYTKNIAYVKVSSPSTINSRPGNRRKGANHSARQRSHSLHGGDVTPSSYPFRENEKRSSPRAPPTSSTTRLNENSTEEWCPTVKPVAKVSPARKPRRYVGSIRQRARVSKEISAKSNGERDLLAFDADEELLGW